MHQLIPIKNSNLVFSPLKDIQTASLGIFIDVGSRYETKSKRGIAHFLEHLLFKGSKHYSYKKIKREIEGRGGMLNGFTTQEMTAYYAHFLNKNLEPTLDILLDMVFNPLLKKEDIDKERNVILEEIKMYNDLPLPRATAILDKLLWTKHPLGEEVIGSFPTVKGIKRGDLFTFKNRHYLPSRMIISCCGNVDKNKLIKLLENKMSVKKTKSFIKQSKPTPLKGLHIKIENKKLQQTYLCIGFRSISYKSKDIFAAQLLNVILGANMSSRLFEQVRERRGLCYDISTEVRKHKDSGAFIIHLGLDKKKLEVALKAILDELKKISEKKVLPKELERAKDYLLGQIVMRLERPQGRMFYLAENYLALKRIYTVEELKRKIESVGASQIMKLAQNILKFNNMCISSVGDIEEKKTEARLRKICKERS